MDEDAVKNMSTQFLMTNSKEIRTYLTISATLSEEMKVIKQEVAYGSSQLFSDLGGSWGLFLGFSIVNLFMALEKALLAFMAP